MPILYNLTYIGETPSLCDSDRYFGEERPLIPFVFLIDLIRGIDHAKQIERQPIRHLESVVERGAWFDPGAAAHAGSRRGPETLTESRAHRWTALPRPVEQADLSAAAQLEHDSEKACPDLIRGGTRFSEKIMHQRRLVVPRLS